MWLKEGDPLVIEAAIKLTIIDENYEIKFQTSGFKAKN